MAKVAPVKLYAIVIEAPDPELPAEVQMLPERVVPVEPPLGNPIVLELQQVPVEQAPSFQELHDVKPVRVAF